MKDTNRCQECDQPRKELHRQGQAEPYESYCENVDCSMFQKGLVSREDADEQPPTEEAD